MENLDKALSEQLEKFGELTPELVEKIAASYVEYYIADASVSIWFYIIGVVFFLLMAGASVLLHDRFDLWGFAAVVFALCSFGCFIGFGNALVIMKAPEAYAVRQLTEAVLKKHN